MAALHEIGLELVAGAQRWVATLADALCWTVTTYDALYVRLALDLDCELVTADRRLVQAGRRARLPVVALHEPPPPSDTGSGHATRRVTRGGVADTEPA